MGKRNKRRERDLQRKQLAELVAPLCEMSTCNTAVCKLGIRCTPEGVIRYDNTIRRWIDLNAEALNALLDSEWDVYKPHHPLRLLAENGI